jgi:hypothetical protein
VGPVDNARGRRLIGASLLGMRPMLLPHLHPLWRSRTTLQLGTDPARAVILEFADPSATRLLELLDGMRTEEQVLAGAARRGVSPESAGTVLATLREAGVVVEARTLVPPGLPEPVRRRLWAEAAYLAVTAGAGAGPGAGAAGAGPGAAGGTAGGTAVASPATQLRRRAAARVLLCGHRGLVAPLAGTLAAAGVGQVAPDPSAAPETAQAIAEAVRLAAPEAEVRPLRPADATFAVHADPALALAGPSRRGQPHLAVAVRDTAVLVGPLVPASGSPCVRCLDLHRADRDPAWPALADQLAAHGGEPLVPATTSLAAAAYTAHEVLAHLDGRPTRTEGAVVEIRQPGGARRRALTAHPRCTCLPRM